MWLPQAYEYYTTFRPLVAKISHYSLCRGHALLFAYSVIDVNNNTCVVVFYVFFLCLVYVSVSIGDSGVSIGDFKVSIGDYRVSIGDCH